MTVVMYNHLAHMILTLVSRFGQLSPPLLSFRGDHPTVQSIQQSFKLQQDRKVTNLGRSTCQGARSTRCRVPRVDVSSFVCYGRASRTGSREFCSAIGV